jgi:hypothetical protein
MILRAEWHLAGATLRWRYSALTRYKLRATSDYKVQDFRFEPCGLCHSSTFELCPLKLLAIREKSINFALRNKINNYKRQNDEKTLYPLHIPARDTGEQC